MTTALEKRIEAFVRLGNLFKETTLYLHNKNTTFENTYANISDAIEKTCIENLWFTKPNIAFALQAWIPLLTKDNIIHWIENYNIDKNEAKQKKVAVIMAGNIPLVGFHDFLCVLISGHVFIGKLSSHDKYLLPAFAEELCKWNPELKTKILFTTEKLPAFEAIIATGSNNSARYFEQYFSDYPHIIRKNRNGIAILDGNETDEELKLLGTDICAYFGLGCRNVSKVYVPQNYDIINVFKGIDPYTQELVNHSKYMNNYIYNKSIMLVNQTFHYENAVALMQQSSQIASPISVLFYETYADLNELKKYIEENDEQIQCVATNIYADKKTVKLGETQFPQLQNYADGVDTLDFLNNF